MTRTISQPYPATLLEVRKFTYRELLEMERIGILQEDQHVELLGGQIVVMTIHPPHAATVSHLNRRFQRVFADRVQVITQNPLRLSDDLEDDNLPQPDVMLVAGPEKVYVDHPRPADVYLCWSRFQIAPSPKIVQLNSHCMLRTVSQNCGLSTWWISRLKFIQNRTVKST
jgi:hypothetical protein